MARRMRGQATVEYAAITTLILVGAFALGTGWPFTKALFEALQQYVDLFFYALNVAIG